MLAVSDQSDFVDFEWLLLTGDMINFLNHAQKQYFGRILFLFQPEFEKKNFKRDFLLIFSESLQKIKLERFKLLT